tara:strand:- start:89 stop:1726 length:1638 start_codon:yes stop_codon:yes gene_type:complete
MTNITHSRKELEKLLGQKLTPELIERISLLGTPVEHVDGESIEIEVFPNRPDLIPIQGFVRAFKAFIGKSTGLKNYTLQKPQKDYKVIVKNDVKAVRPYTVCSIIKNLKFDDEKIKEIINLQEKLHTTLGRNRKKVAIGIYPLEKIKLPITYTAKNPLDIKFQPLGFPKEINAKQVLSKHPAGRKYAHLLKDQKKFPVFIDSANSVLSIPPIINSHETGKISEKTNSIFIECSGHDLNTLNKALNIIVTTLADMGGRVYPMTIEKSGKHVTPNLTPDKIKISLENANKLLGLELKESDLSKLLPKMGYNYKSGVVQVPAWRTDILHEVDIIEDIAIAYGYDNFKEKIPNISTIGEESKKSKIKRRISEILTGLQSLEILSYHLIKPEEVGLMKLQNTIELIDSKTEYKILRPNLLIPTLRILSENLDVEYPQKLFEMGIVFQKDSEFKKETGIHEQDNLILATSPGNFTQIKQHLDYLLNTLDIDFKIEESQHSQLIDGRTADIFVKDKKIGYIGEVHPVTLKKWGLKMPLAVFEISLEEIYDLL